MVVEYRTTSNRKMLLNVLLIRMHAVRQKHSLNHLYEAWASSVKFIRLVAGWSC